MRNRFFSIFVIGTIAYSIWAGRNLVPDPASDSVNCERTPTLMKSAVTPSAEGDEILFGVLDKIAAGE